ncbi:ABC transporter permease [Maribellus maritimus]|uniref:ABC transporter permease n=1 Tax=Maribellus maritimus TaxID=2870838 RepID=UPI001EEA1FD2|nr:ABC transporter permease [Maribellus maritimus]MCG6189810.1 ABC transporter permease [Maribellus maritimus]
MIKYFLKLEWRNLTRNKYISILKITGFVIGLWVFMVTGYYVLHESGFDHFQKNAENKYLLDARDQFGEMYFSFSLPYPLTDSLQNRYPEVVQSTSFEMRENAIFIGNDDGFIKSDKSKMAFVEESFFDFFESDFIIGSVQSSFSNPNPLIVSEDVANKYFNGANAIGKPVRISLEDNIYDFVVTAIIQNPADNSNVNFHWIGSLQQFMKTAGKTNYASDWDFKCKSYVQLKKGIAPNDFTKKLTDEYVTHAKLERAPTLISTPLTKIHLTSDVQRRIRIFSALGILILIISIVNYVLLSTVEKTQQMRYLGIEKISGARRSDFFQKNIASVLLYSIVSFLITVGLFVLSKPYFKNFFEGSFSSDLNVTTIVLTLLATVFSIVFLSAFINQIINGSQKPLDILKNKFSKGITGKIIFNSLLTFQLAAFITLISCSVFVQKQLSFMQKSKLGFNQESLITVKIAPEDIKNYPTFKNELLRNSSILDVSGTSAPPLSDRRNIFGFVSKDSLGNETIKVVDYVSVDRDFFKTLELKFKEGTTFPEFAEGYCVVNQTFIEEREIKDPWGESVELGGNKYKICGIMEDFHSQSMRSKIEPFVVFLDPGQITHSILRFKGSPLETVALLKNAANQYFPNTVFEYEFMDTKIKSLYKTEARFGNTIKILTFLSVLIAVLGLLGLAYFSSLVKIKEIGIRKVNGARISEILAMLNKDFVKWVVIAFVIATPIAYFAMTKWLESFAYKTSLSWWIFALAGVLALGIALLTVSWQSWKAAARNPVEALRYE